MVLQSSNVKLVYLFAGDTSISRRSPGSALGSGQSCDVQVVSQRIGLPSVGCLTRGFAASPCGTESPTLPDLIAKVEGYVGVKDTKDTAMLSQVCTKLAAFHPAVTFLCTMSLSKGHLCSQ